MLYCQWDDDALQYVLVMLVVGDWHDAYRTKLELKTDTKNEAEGRGSVFWNRSRGLLRGTSSVRALEGASFLTRDHHKTTNIGFAAK